jgi:hypothetical protein
MISSNSPRGLKSQTPEPCSEQNQNVKGDCQRQCSTPAKTAGKLSDAMLATRYLDLQRLRDEVRKAEARFASASLRKVSISRSPSGSDPARRN